ncbi:MULTISPECIES: DUF3828 domain-containing protein [unclassified Devosia]|uniref:DUF3828 domain-containing protein n=1 Tax=unclassified Devosia TaxID=196773 RepID=UPI0025ECAE16|nr:DUF3828 domain-containing protein [Devosia sp.]MCR6634337.1 YbjP/YqhG family protein [Devosia sp.]
MRRFAFVLAAMAVLGAPASFAQPFETPQELLEAFYEPYFSGDFPEFEADYRSEALNALYEADAENTPEGEIGALDFDPYVDGQDYDLAEFVIGEPVESDGAATVEVTFTNFGEPRHITYELVYENGGWLIDDLVGENPDFTYRLSEIFAEAATRWQ